MARIFYLKRIESVYKVSVRNRSLEEQAILDGGSWSNGSKQKNLVIYCATYKTSDVIYAWEESVYTVPKNGDVSVYCYTEDGGTYKYFAGLRFSSLHYGTNDEYQIAYEILGDDSSVEED